MTAASAVLTGGSGGIGVATECDVPEVIGFLASDRAARVTGQLISINGGISAG